MRTEAVAPTLQQDLSVVFKQGLTLFLLLVVSGLLGYLPGTDLQLWDRLPILVLLRFAIAAGMTVVLLFAYRHVARLLRHVVAAVLPRGLSTPALEASAVKVANNTTLLVYVCLLYGIVMQAGEPLIAILTTAPWPLNLVRLGSLVLAVIALIGVCIGASPLFREAGDALATQVTPPSEAPAGQIKCPGCGVLDEGGSKYCRFCGRLLAGDAPAPAAVPPPVVCSRCGSAVKQPARFCPACGKPV